MPPASSSPVRSTDRTVLIVGGGIVGLCSAYYALQKGCRVTVLERNAPDHTGCSLGNAGMVVPSHFTPLAAPGMVGLGLRMLLNPESPFAIRPRLDADLLRWGWQFTRHANAEHVKRSAPLLRDMNLASRALYERLNEEIGDFGLVKRGLLMLCKTEHAFHEEAEVAKQAKALGLRADVVTPEEAAKRDPGLRMDIAGGVHFLDDCHLSPNRLLPLLARAVEQNGGTIRWGSEVRRWRTAAGRITAAETTQGDMTADEYVLAGGAWSPGLVKPLGLRLPMEAGKGYSLTLSQPRRLPELCSILTEARIAVTPMGSALRFAGTMEVTGEDLTVNHRRVDGILKAIPQYFPDFAASDFHGLPVWSGLRPCSPDGLPYIGRFARYANLSAATGHSMMGISLGPVTGRLTAEILSGEKPSIDITALSPDRYR